MSQSAERLSIPYARLDGHWEVLRETDDGRPTVAVREDENAGVAQVHPYVETNHDRSINRIAVVRNVSQGYVLVAVSVESLAAVGERTAGRTRRVDSETYDALSDPELVELLAGETLLLVDPESRERYPGALQLFGGARGVRRTWGEDFPRLEQRMAAVDRLLAGADLEAVVRRRASTPDATGP